MAFRTWGRLLLTALGVSVLAGAGQLGVAYGFGIVRLTGAFTGTTVNQWPTQLVWVGWFAANAAVAGAVLTGRLARRDAPAPSTGRQLAIGGAAALGATVIAPLCMQPARAAELISVDPVWAVGICAVLGAVIGAGAAIAVLLRPELGWNMAAVAGAVWLLAMISVLPSLGTAGPLPTVRLGVLEPSWLDDSAAQRLALLLLPIVALLAGAATAGLARWRGQAPLVSGATGVAGPVLVAFAYLTAGPGDTVDRYQATPYYGSLIAILAGALGAAAAALLPWPGGARTGDTQAIEPSDILRPLPPGPELPGTELPGTASTDSPNESATAERTDAKTPADTKPAALVPGPWAADGSDGVRTVPAHWDWPATTTGGQHGPPPAAAAATPDAPAKPASWLTDPTGEFTADTRTRRLSPEDSTSSADSERSATTDVSSPTSGSPTNPASTSGTAGRAGAAAPAVGPTGDEPTDSATTRTNGPATDDRGIRASTTSTGAASTDATSTASAGATSTGKTGTDATSTGKASTDKTGIGTTGAASTGAVSAGAASTGAGDAAAALKPRRTRKPKVGSDATSDAPGETSPTESKSSDDTAAGRTKRGTHPGRSADSTGSGTPTDTPVVSNESQDAGSDQAAKASPARATAAVPTTATGTTGAPAAVTGPAAEAVDPPRTPVTGVKSEAATARTATADPKAAAVKPPRAAATSPTSEVADPKAGPPRTPADATTDSTAPPADAATGSTAPATSTTAPPATATASSATPPADPAGASAADRAGDADEARTATEDGSAAGLFGITTTGNSDTDRWTPARSPWPVTSAWTVPPQTPGQESTASDAPTEPDKPSGPTQRPRHRAPLPDLSRASTWNAFDTTRRTGPTDSPDPSTIRTTPTGPTTSSETSTPPENPSASDFPVVPVTAGTASDTDDPASVDATPTPGKVAEQPSRRGRLGGLFRRNRSRAEEGQEPAGETEPLPAQDEEFVDWVAGLSKPVSDNEPEQGNARRSLRSTGRHHRE
ncbi:hypothetical protein [Micromonospora sp. B9E7]|uniref:hypothetical protein n=1 Tax=Micromonospora sp. B9E7 TaxID=3153574 RepID=UPI00325DA5DB